MAPSVVQLRRNTLPPGLGKTNTRSPSTGQHNDVDSLLRQSTGRKDQVFLSRRIEFRESVRPDRKMDQLKKKYRPINRPLDPKDTPSANKDNPHTSVVPQKPLVDPVSGFRRAAHVLFPRDTLRLTWDTIRPVGPGLQNLGNTCFLNSVLQCLTYTPPLVNYLLTREHSSQCRSNDFCMLCELERHVSRCGEHRQSQAICPKKIVGRLRSIAKHMRLGRQEDSHEFLRYVIEAMQDACLFGYDPKIDHRIKETTFVHVIFGGYLQSQVKCLVCHADSNTFDPFLDLSLEVRHCTSLQRALQTFTKAELLSGKNRYKCEKCNKLVDARKQMTIYQPPEVLTVQLKRFNFGHSFGGKITKEIEYSETLDLGPYLSRRGTKCQYRLYGVLVHAGATCRSGHYFCFIKSSAGTWYCMDDSSVRQVSLSTVLSRSAYLLFYTRTEAPSPSLMETVNPSPASKATLKRERFENDSSHHKRVKMDAAGTFKAKGNSYEIGEAVDQATASKLFPMAVPPRTASVVKQPTIHSTPRKQSRTEGAGLQEESIPLSRASSAPSATKKSDSQRSNDSVDLPSASGSSPSHQPRKSPMQPPEPNLFTPAQPNIPESAKSTADVPAALKLKPNNALDLVSTSRWTTSKLVETTLSTLEPISPSDSNGSPHTKGKKTGRKIHGLRAAVRRSNEWTVKTLSEVTNENDAITTSETDGSVNGFSVSTTESTKPPIATPVTSTQPRQRNVTTVVWNPKRTNNISSRLPDADRMSQGPDLTALLGVKRRVSKELLVDTWDNDDDQNISTHQERNQLLRELNRQRPKNRPLSKWDQELDRGRLKKVKKPTEVFGLDNSFQQFQDHLNINKDPLE
ncbi:hypothetical protein IWQ61_009308 [Dispira simplex]|nr:hypothetical protein IWQ61_009308 [Dispira simplex]